MLRGEPPRQISVGCPPLPPTVEWRAQLGVRRLEPCTYAEAVDLLRKTNDLLVDVGRLAMEVQTLMIWVLGETCPPISDSSPRMTAETEVAGHG
jgi:hypothetical protein